MSIFEEDFWVFFKYFLIFMFKIILYVSPVLIWYVIYQGYLKADEAERITIMYLAIGVGISMAICFLRNMNDTKSSFMQLYKGCLMPINIFTDIIFIVYMFYVAISEGETIGWEMALGIILPILVFVFLISFGVTLVTVCIIILYQAFTKGYKLYKEIKGMVTDKGVQLFFKIIIGIFTNGYDYTKKKVSQGGSKRF